MAPVNNLRFAVCIQARLGSTRLPGKVLKNLAGAPMIKRIAEQALASKQVQELVITTSNDAQDDTLADYASQNHFRVFRGPVDNIITRLHGALQTTSCDALVRIWGDCPFICPDIIDEMTFQMIKENLDFIHNSDISKRTFPPGLDIEIYRRELLEKMNEDVKDEKLREFPVEYVKSQKSLRYSLYTSPDDMSAIHLTVDYPQDFAAAEKLYLALEKEKIPFDYSTLIKVLKKTGLAQEFSSASRNIEYQKFLNETYREKA